MKELVVISGKGGTGKTTIVAAFAALAEGVVLADCDVDAADLHLITAPEIEERHLFSGGKKARVMAERCTACGRCEAVCRFGAVTADGPASGTAARTFLIDRIACEGCSVCAEFCPAGAIALEPAQSGEWFVSRTRFGAMVHARLGIAESNSGKLVALVREKARALAERDRRRLILVDGSPGIGCPVIASLTGADLAMVVTEPTVSGLHDLRRVCDLTRHFGIRTLLCVNRWDLNEEATRQIEAEAGRLGAEAVGRVAYDEAVTAAQVAGKSVIEFGRGPASDNLRVLWRRVFEAASRETVPGGRPEVGGVTPQRKRVAGTDQKGER